MSKDAQEKVAAGGVALDWRASPPRVLLVHRPRYDDWSFPKGGVEPDETLEAAALREVGEETGVACHVVRPLAVIRYTYRTKSGEPRPKVVHYFLMEPVGGEPRPQGDETDMVCWAAAAEALRLLSYAHDIEILRNLLSDGPPPDGENHG